MGQEQDYTEGLIDFAVPQSSLTTQTYYRVFGNLSDATLTPLVVLHGGPGMCCDYCWPLAVLSAKHNTPVITYDQIGNGRSTHLPDRNGDAAFWSEDLFIAELENLLRHLLQSDTTSSSSNGRKYAVLGHSWGGMLAARFATRQPPGLQKIVVSNSPASINTWVEACESLRAQLPPDVEQTLRRHEQDGTTDSPEYEAAVDVFYRRHFCRVVPFPTLVQTSIDWVRKDPTTYNTMNGPSEFFVIGSLRHWTIESELHRIQVPTLVLNGDNDEASDACVEPYVSKIARSQWHRFTDASHMSWFEQPDEYVSVVAKFLHS